MEKIRDNFSRYFLPNLDDNSIKHRGCKWITASNWPKIKAMHLCLPINISETCFIGDEGCRSIAKQNKQLLFILGKIDLSKVGETISERLACAS